MKTIYFVFMSILFSGCLSASCAKTEKATVIEHTVNEEIALDAGQKDDKEICYIRNETTLDIFYTLRYDSYLADGRSLGLDGGGSITLGRISLEEKYDAVRERLSPGTQNRLFLINITDNRGINAKRLISSVLGDLFVYDSNNKIFITWSDVFLDYYYDRYPYEREQSDSNILISYGMETIEGKECRTFTITITDKIIEIGLSINSPERILELISRDKIKHAVDFPIDGINIKMVSDFVIVGKTLVKYLGQSETLIIPDGIETIGSYAFHFFESTGRMRGRVGLESIKEIVLPDTLKIIGDFAFYYLINLEKINIPVTVTNIGDAAFMECHNLKRIVLPDSIFEIGSSAFTSSGLESIIIPPKIKSISSHSFMHCGNLVSVSLPIGLESIGEAAFLECQNLENINIPETVVFIDYNAFSFCNKLTVGILPPAHRHRSYLFDYLKLDG